MLFRIDFNQNIPIFPDKYGCGYRYNQNNYEQNIP